MRITQGQLVSAVINNINRQLKSMTQRQIEISTGKRINKPSDDPAGVTKAVNLRSDLRSIDQFKKNIEDGMAWLNMTDSTLNQLESLLTEARTLAVQSASASISEKDRQVLAQQVHEILNEVLSIGNTKFRGKYIFAGTNTQNSPYVAVKDASGKITAITFNTNTGPIEREVDQGVKVGVNIPGSDVFQEANGVFRTLIRLRDSLSENKLPEIQDSIDQLDKDVERSLQARTVVGARVQRLEMIRTRLDDNKLNLTEVLSQTEDVDFVEAITQLQVDEYAYQATLATAAKILQPSLIDFLR